MTNLPKAFTLLAVLAFLLAIVANFTGPIAGTSAEGFSRACTNLALLAIAVSMVLDRTAIVARSTMP
jgi:hypothetical protein